MAIHLGPSVARRLMRPTRGLGSAPLPPSTVSRRRVAPSYLALLRVEFARFTPTGGLRRRSASSLWHWSSPHGGRALPATLRCGARTFLTPPTGHPVDDARPSDRLADLPIVALAGIRTGPRRSAPWRRRCARPGTERVSPGAGAGAGGARRSQRSSSARAPSSSRMSARRRGMLREPRLRGSAGHRCIDHREGVFEAGSEVPPALEGLDGVVDRVLVASLECRHAGSRSRDASPRWPRRGSTWLRTPRSPRWLRGASPDQTAARIAKG